MRVSRRQPHSIRDGGPCLVGDPHDAPHHLTNRHIPSILILLHRPVVDGRGGGDRAGATHFEPLKNTSNVTLLRNTNCARLAVATECPPQKQNDLFQVLRRKKSPRALTKNSPKRCSPSNRTSSTWIAHITNTSFPMMKRRAHGSARLCSKPILFMPDTSLL